MINLKNGCINNIRIISSRILIFTRHYPTKFMKPWKNVTEPKEGKNKVTINMWTLLNKQVLKRQSTACAQNGAATIKRLGQDVHQSVVFQKIPNKSSLSINGRTSQKKSYSAIHASGERWRGAILHYTMATAVNTCGRVAATWAIPPGTWLRYLPETHGPFKRTTFQGPCILY